MISTKSLLLAGTALLMLAAPAAHAGAVGGGMVIAQAAPPHEADKEKEKKAPEKGEKAAHPQAKPQQKPAEKAAPQPHQAQPKAPEQKPAAQHEPQHEAPKAAQQAPQPKHEEKRQETQKPEAKPATAARPAPQKEKENAPAAAEHKPEQKPAAAEHKPEEKHEQKPAAQQQQKPQAPAAQTKPAAPNQPPAAAQAPAPQKPAAQSAPAAQPPAGNAQTNTPAKPGAQTAAPAAPAAPQKPQSAQQFILPKNGKPTATIQDVRKERHETREGNRTVITEGDRTIVKQDNRTIIRHNETQRFAVGARDVNVEHRGNETTTVIVRPDGDRIINVTDERGHLIRRVRRERGGREVVIIDERSIGPRAEDVFVDLPPPVIRIPRDRYIVELDRARPETVYEVLDAPPVETVDETYTVDQVRYSAPLRERMPRVDLDINFDTGSWQLTPEQIDKLSVVAEGLNRAIERNPREVFLIEGHTDAVGSAEDNLSLSDRRAESVAVALTEQFHVPPENLVTQGYGEEDLKVQTQGASRANRRVSVRRITPLIDRQAAR